jgi:hypothetical protein
VLTSHTLAPAQDLWPTAELLTGCYLEVFLGPVATPDEWAGFSLLGVPLVLLAASAVICAALVWWLRSGEARLGEQMPLP